MPAVTIDIIPLKPAPVLRFWGTVVDGEGRPLSRTVVLYDMSGAMVDRATSDAADGSVEFALSGRNATERFVARAIGRAGECDDISCPLLGEPAGG